MQSLVVHFPATLVIGIILEKEGNELKLVVHFLAIPVLVIILEKEGKEAKLVVHFPCEINFYWYEVFRGIILYCCFAVGRIKKLAPIIRSWKYC